METYNIYMDEAPVGSELDGEEELEVEFRVVPNSSDNGEPEDNAVLAGLDCPSRVQEVSRSTDSRRWRGR